MDNLLKDFEKKFEKCIESLNNDFQTMRVGRANPKILDKVHVNYYGTTTPLPQMCNISIPEARLLIIQPYDKSSLKEIEKAINMSDIGINPINDGSVIRLTFPELTEERRKELSKEVKKRGDEAKVAIRNIRKDGMDYIKKLEKDGETTEDDTKKLNNDLQKGVDKYVGIIDKDVDEKIKEVMKI